MKENDSAKLQALFANDKFEAEFTAIDDPAKLPELFKEYGMPMSEEELSGLLSSVCKNKTGEIDLSELDKVSGGITVHDALKSLGLTFAWGRAMSLFGSPKKLHDWLKKYKWEVLAK